MKHKKMYDVLDGDIPEHIIKVVMPDKTMITISGKKEIHDKMSGENNDAKKL